MTAATSVLPELDAETVEGLRPPCDTTRRNDGQVVSRCGRTAEWVCRIRCDACATVHEGLMCDPHRCYFFDQHGESGCVGCRLFPMPYTCLSVERL